MRRVWKFLSLFHSGADPGFYVKRRPKVGKPLRKRKHTALGRSLKCNITFRYFLLFWQRHWPLQLARAGIMRKPGSHGSQFMKQAETIFQARFCKQGSGLGRGPLITIRPRLSITAEMPVLVARMSQRPCSIQRGTVR